MNDRLRFVLAHDVARSRAIEAVRTAPEGWYVEVKAPTRTLLQNARMWAMLTDISRQVDWYGQKLTTEEWKDVFSAALNQQKVIPGVNGGFVVCATRTSQMTKREMGDMMELMGAFGAEHDVEWSEPEAPEYAHF